MVLGFGIFIWVLDLRVSFRFWVDMYSWDMCLRVWVFIFASGIFFYKRVFGFLFDF